jgi:hypothetical protein
MRPIGLPNPSLRFSGSLPTGERSMGRLRYRTARRYAVAIASVMLVAGIVAGTADWYRLRYPFVLGFPAVSGLAHACEPVTAASWSVDGKSGRTWAVSTNLHPCDAVRRKVSQLAGKGLVAIAQEPELRCTAAAIVDGEVLSGICYTPGSHSATDFFAWGATVSPYDRLAPCQTCSGVPGELVAPGSGVVPVTAASTLLQSNK